MKFIEKYDDVDDISKSEIISEKLLKSIHIHNFFSSDILSPITGGMGSDKTSTMLSRSRNKITFLNISFRNDKYLYFNKKL